MYGIAHVLFYIYLYSFTYIQAIGILYTMKAFGIQTHVYTLRVCCGKCLQPRRSCHTPLRCGVNDVASDSLDNASKCCTCMGTF